MLFHLGTAVRSNTLVSVSDFGRYAGMTWNWNWNGLWCAGTMSLVLSIAFDVPLGYRVALYPICIQLFGLNQKQRDLTDH